MPENVTNESLYEILKQLQPDSSDVKKILADHTRQMLAIRQDINNLRGDDLRRETIQAQMDIRLERIENRLNLNDAAH